MEQSNILQKVNDRNIGLDILKIISMCLITFRHYIGYLDLTNAIEFTSVNGILVNTVSVFCSSAVNIFVIISGYFLVKSQFKVQKIIKLWAEVWFYSVLMFAIGAALGSYPITASTLVFSFLPVSSRHYWFPVTYLIMYAFSPLLNKLLLNLTKKEYTTLVLLGAVVLSAWTTFFYFSDGAVTGGNTGLLWFIYLYLLGGYFKLFDIKLKKNYTALIILLITVFLVAFKYFQMRIPFLQNFSFKTDDSIFELILSVCLFILFLDIRQPQKKGASKIIFALSKCSFGVYLIQESCMFREYLWKDLVGNYIYADKWYLIFTMLGVAFALFFAAWVISSVFCKLFGAILKILQKKHTAKQ